MVAAGSKQNKLLNKIVRDTVSRFPHLGNRTIARYILDNYGEAFDGSLENIRSRVRRVVGQHGDKSRKTCLSAQYRPTVQHIPETWRRQREDYHLPIGLWLILSDIHIPFHEPGPLEAAIQYGQSQGVNGLFFNGDIQDCAAVSYWPTRRRDFNREIELCIDFWDFIQHEFPDQKKVYKPGNHEYRLPQYFLRNAPELIDSPLVAMETIMNYEGRGIEFLDYHQKVIAGKLPIIHGHEIRAISRAVNPARGLFLKAKTFCACSHCHTTSEHTETSINGKIMTTWSFGCLCDLSPDWSAYGNNWNHGFALVNVEKEGFFEVENKRILPNGKVV